MRPLRPQLDEIVDLWWRSVWTFIATFTGALGAGGLGWVDTDALEAALIAGVGSVITVISVTARQRIGTIQQPPPEPLRTVEHETPPVR